MIEPRDHLVPVSPLPIHAATGGTSPERLMSGPDSVWHEILHLFPGSGHEDLVTSGAAGQWIDEAERKGGRDLADLFFEIVGPDLDRPTDAAREFLVPCQENSILQSNAFDEGPIRTRFGIRGVVPHEPKPTGEAPQHVVAKELHWTTEYSKRTSSPRRSVRSSRRRIESSRDVAPSPPARVGAE